MATDNTGADEKPLTEVRCFTNKDTEPDPEVYREYFQAKGKIVGELETRRTVNGTWFLYFTYEEGFRCKKGKQVINGSPAEVRLGNFNSERRRHGDCSPYGSPMKRPKTNPQTKEISSLQWKTNFTQEKRGILNFLLKLREYGKRMKGDNWQQFSVLAVLIKPVDTTQPVIYPEDLEKINGFIDVAVPSSYTACLDDVEDGNKSVVHAECKLVGDPGKKDRKLCVPYERCKLYSIIENHRMEHWEQHRTLPSVRYKIFVYSEHAVCPNCEQVLRKSVFHFSQKYNDLEPVVGHCLENATESNSFSYKKYGIDFVAGPNMAKITRSDLPLQPNDLQADHTRDLGRGDPGYSKSSEAN